MSLFQIVREDGQSNADVLLGYVRDGEPGRVYTYQELADVLEVGVDREFDVPAVRSVVGAAFGRLLREQQRTLYNLRGQGYRLAYAKDHNRLALVRKRRSDTQMRRGLEMLQNVRFEEMNDNERKAHEGTLMLLSAVYQNQRSLERRQAAVEQALSDLTNKMSGFGSVNQAAQS